MATSPAVPQGLSEAKVLTLRYGADWQQITVPARNVLDEAGMREVAPVQDSDSVVETALDHPIGTGRLEELARDCGRVVVLVDDLTRPTPAYRVLPGLLRRFEQAGIAREAICLMVATGTHRPMTPAELAAKIGPLTVSQYEVVNHDCRGDLVDLGVTPSGIPIMINRRVAEADFVVAVSNIVPHRYCGWAGGAKMIQPGVSGEATTAGTHLMITKYPDVRLGVVENPVRHEMEAVAERVHLKFIVNTILDRHGNLLHVVAGDFRLAFRRGVALARSVYSAPVRGQADIVLASAYPCDVNLMQAGKAFYSADLVVRQGGIIILVSPCYEGIGEHHEFMELLHYDYATQDEMVARGQVRDRVGAAASLAVALVLARAQIWLVAGGVTPEQAKRMRMTHFDSLQSAVHAALAAQGPAARITVLHEATELLPELPA
jgi:nickel-dependent lactate racemase